MKQPIEKNGNIVETHYTIIYDLPARTTKFLDKKGKKIPYDELTKDQRETLERESKMEVLRVWVQSEVSRLATFINLSVYILPQQNLPRAEELIAKVKERYLKELNIEPDITILRYHNDSTEKIRTKAKDALLKSLNKLLDNMDILGDRLADQKRGMRKSEKNKLLQKVDDIEKLAKSFKISNDVKNIVEIVDAKIKSLETE